MFYLLTVILRTVLIEVNGCHFLSLFYLIVPLKSLNRSKGVLCFWINKNEVHIQLKKAFKYDCSILQDLQVIIGFCYWKFLKFFKNSEAH